MTPARASDRDDDRVAREEERHRGALDREAERAKQRAETATEKADEKAEAAEVAAEVAEDAGEPKARRCPNCRERMTRHGDGSPYTAGAWHCSACGGCWRGTKSREGHPAPAGYAGA